ncbi:hypothetical protein [Epilithonimonas sp.]|uniref:hypothetical protein n=1 Tax=Epilithonimonas sp. TaxID=2894511 RepID=UPI0028A1D74B|nr:hypothetical protein [Epilithonimonas sp.]
MKKNIFLSSLIFLSLSCSSSNDDETIIVDPQYPILVTKAIVDGDVYIVKYDGIKILEESNSDGSNKFVYTYTGNFITQINDYSNGSLRSTADFTYDGDKLINVKEVSITSGSNTTSTKTLTYTYPNSTTINCTQIRNYTFAGNSQTDKSDIVYTVKDGDVISSKEKYYHNNVLAGNLTETYTYDDKNNPFKNILGFDKMELYNPWASNDNLSGKKNLVLFTNANTPTNSASSSYKIMYTTSYNNKDYPNQITETQYNSSNQAGSSHTTIFTYNQ